MEELTSKDRQACCRPAAISLECPVCGKRGRKVGKDTLDHHLAAAARSKFGDQAGFCANPTCEVVYFDGAATVLKGETLIAVTQKDRGDEVNVCYCFDFKRADIRRDLVARGATDILDQIKRGIDEGRCACERMNPQGACCLGNVAAAVKQIAAELKTGGSRRGVGER